MRSLPVFLLVLLPATALAHGSHAVHTLGRAVVVTLDPGHGPAAAGWRCTVLPPESDEPWAEGTADAAGRFAFVPDRTGPWLVRAFTADGHGAQVVVAVDQPMLEALAGGGPAEPVPSAPPPPGWSRLVTGVSVLFGVFGLAVLIQNRRR